MNKLVLIFSAVVIVPSLTFGISPARVSPGPDPWPQFRGVQAAGVSADRYTPVTWDVEKGENVLWRTRIPGLSHSAPIVWGNRVYVTTAVREGEAELKIGIYGGIKSADDQKPHQWRLLALDRTTGRVIFDRSAHQGVPRVKRHTKASHCNSTPATDGRYIVAILGSEGLFCFDMKGRLLWRKNLGPMDSGYFRSPTAQWGFGSSPVVQDGKVVVLCDVQKDSYLAQFDLADGREIWRTPRKDVPTWSTPTLVEVGGRTRILVNGWHHTGGYDFESGREIWKLDGGGDIPVPTPILGRDVAYFTSAHGGAAPMRAIRLGATGDITPEKISATNESIPWVHERRGNYMQTPILVGDFLYGCTDRGVLTCFDAKTGEVRYRERIGKGPGGFTASPVSDGRHLYFTGEKGNVIVIPAAGSFSVAARNELKDNCLATPAISNGTLFFRTQHGVTAVRRVLDGP